MKLQTKRKPAVPDDPWVGWHRDEEAAEAWEPVLVGSGERDTTTALNGLRLSGDVMILPAGFNPNDPQPLPSEAGCPGRRPR